MLHRRRDNNDGLTTIPSNLFQPNPPNTLAQLKIKNRVDLTMETNALAGVTVTWLNLNQFTDVTLTIETNAMAGLTATTMSISQSGHLVLAEGNSAVTCLRVLVALVRSNTPCVCATAALAEIQANSLTLDNHDQISMGQNLLCSSTVFATVTINHSVQCEQLCVMKFVGSHPYTCLLICNHTTTAQE